MSQIWNLQNPPLSDRTRLLAGRIDKLMGRHFPGIENEFQKHLSLWEFLMAHRDTPVAEMREHVLEKGKPVFSLDEMKAIMNIVHKSPKVSGGGGGRATTSADADPSRSKFWDKFIHKITHPVTKHIPKSFDTLLWFFFILYNMEQMEIVGPMIATMLDTVTLSLPVIADLTGDVASSLVELAPIPYAGILGDVLGYGISLFFISIAVTMNTSRKHFGSAFKATLEAIPMIGDVLSEGAQSFEIAAERYLQNRNRTLGAIRNISPKAEKFLDYYVPDVNIKKGPAPPWDMPGMKIDVIEYGARKAGIMSNHGTVAIPTIPTLGKKEKEEIVGPPIIAIEEKEEDDSETNKDENKNSNKTLKGGRRRLRLRRTRKHKNKCRK